MTKILRCHAVMEKTGLSRSTIYLKVSTGDFPQSITLGANSVGWLEDEVNEWINSRASERKMRNGLFEGKERGRVPAMTSEGNEGMKRTWVA